MKKKVTAKSKSTKTTSKAHATKRAVSTKSNAKASPVKSKATAKKTRAVAAAKPKGLHRKVHHHAKRLYHATPKFVHGMFVGALVGVMVVGFLGGSTIHPGSANAATGEPIKPIGGNCVVKTDANNTYKITGSKATATFDVTGNCTSQAVTLTSWEAPNGTDGKPYSSQTLFAHSTGTFAPGTHTLTVALPNCYYQLDLILGSAPTDATGSPDYAMQGILRRSLHGGTQSCATTPTPTPTNPTPTPLSSTPTALPNTGPAALFIVVGLAIVGGYVFHMTHHHVKKRKHARAAH